MEAIEFAKLATVIAIAAAVAAVAVYDVFYGWPMHRRLRALEQSLAALGAQPTGVAEVAARLETAEARLGEQLGHIRERLAELELAAQGISYERAIGLAERGEESERLLPYLGLTETEADLVRLLHGGRVTL